MALEWFDSIDDEELLGRDREDSYFCPYTDAAQCALLTKGLQPQELCHALECDQVKLVRGQYSLEKCHNVA